MSEKLGYVTFEKEKKPIFLPSSLISSREYSEDTAKQIDEEVKKIIDEAHQKVKEILTAQRGKLDELARLLLEKEVVEEEDLKRIIDLPAS
jgi:cell division protease FtsH